MRIPDGSRTEATQEHSKLGLEAVEPGRFAEMEMIYIGGKKGKSGIRDKYHSMDRRANMRASHWYYFR